MPKYAMVVDQRRCVACMACVIACKKENDVPPGQFRTRVREMVEGDRLTELSVGIVDHLRQNQSAVLADGVAHRVDVWLGG